MKYTLEDIEKAKKKYGEEKKILTNMKSSGRNATKWNKQCSKVSRLGKEVLRIHACFYEKSK